MSIQWNKDLATGIAWQDSQHQELIAKLNILTDAINQKKGGDEILSTLQFLDGYVVTHFGAEESAMKEKGYPNQAAHLKEHQHFKTMLSKGKGELTTDNHSAVAVKMFHELMLWLVSHIKKDDKALGEFLKGTG